MQFSFISAAKELLLTGNLRFRVSHKLKNFLPFQSSVPYFSISQEPQHTKIRSWWQVLEIRYHFVAFCQIVCPFMINIVQKTQNVNHSTQRSKTNIVISVDNLKAQENDFFISQRHFNKEISSKKK